METTEKKLATNVTSVFAHTVKNNYYILSVEKLKMWDHIRNVNKNPHQISINSVEKFWWNCTKCGHIFHKPINSNCEKCYNISSTSMPEIRLLHLFVIVFGIENVISPLKLSYGRSEIDIFLPKLNIGIEYDGVNYHKSDEKKIQDLYKNEHCQKSGYTLFRIREEGLDKISDLDIIYNHRNISNLKEAFFKLITLIRNDYGLSKEEENNLNLIQDFDSILVPDEVFAIRNIVVLENPLSKSHPVIANNFIHEKNHPLTTDIISSGMSHRCWWTCLECGNDFNQTISNNINHEGVCSICRNPDIIVPNNETSDSPTLASTNDYFSVQTNTQNEVKVIFDENTPSQFEVLFTRRGFALEGTRLSFEELETALSKKYIFVLKTGFVLDSIKITKIMLYKNSMKRQFLNL